MPKAIITIIIMRVQQEGLVMRYLMLNFITVEEAYLSYLTIAKEGHKSNPCEGHLLVLFT